MGLALQKSTDGGATFQQVSVDVADYTLIDGVTVANYFISTKDSQNNTYIVCAQNANNSGKGKLLKISSSGVITWCTIGLAYSATGYRATPGGMIQVVLNRDESLLYMSLCKYGGEWGSSLFTTPTDFINGTEITPSNMLSGTFYTEANTPKFAIYKDQYIWVASGTTIKIYNYDTKAELATMTVSTQFSVLGNIVAVSDNTKAELKAFYVRNNYGTVTFHMKTVSYNAPSTTLLETEWTKPESGNTVLYKTKQLLIDRFGDLIILTNSGTASTLLKYSNTGTLIDTVNLSVAGILGVGRGAYGLQVYSKDNGTKCWVQFSNDLGTWRTAETTAQGQVFGAVSKLRDNGVTVYGDDHGGDNNYSVRC